MRSEEDPGLATASGSGGEGRRTSDFEYELPDGRIARYPADRRDESRLLVVRRDAAGSDDGPGAAFLDRRFRDLTELVSPGDALVLNDTRVFPARLLGKKPTGASAEVLLLRPLAPDATGPDGPEGDAGRPEAGPGAPPEEAGRRWEALVRPGGKLKPGRQVVVADGFRVHIEDSTPSGGRIVRLEGEDDPWSLIRRHGRTPIPPYLERETEPVDRRRYQTVYAERTGSVAAPTAGLHFTEELLSRLEGAGVRLARVTLHVGVGTFRPVDVQRPEEHELHEERYEVTQEAARALNDVRGAGGRVWAVGTTVARTLETVTTEDGRYLADAGTTDLFIHPPYRFRGVDRLITNFHLPRSSLLMLVSAFAGHRLTLRAYRHAVREGYRFYSYGDAMVIL